MPNNPAPSPTGTDPTIRETPTPIPELVALGERFTAARQARGLELQELARRLCIGHEQLQALENADTSRLPELVYLIAQVRRVAESLGVDAEEAIAVLRSAAKARRSAPTTPPARPPRASTPRAGRTPTPSTPRAPGAVGSSPSRAWLAGAGLLLSAAALGLGVLWQRTTSPSASSGPSHASVRRDGPSTVAADKPKPLAGAAEAPPAAGPAQLKLRSAEPSWIAVRDSQGVTLFEGTLEGEKSFPLGQGLQVMAGRPDLVRAELAGQEPRVLGPIDQVIWHSFAAAPQKAAAARSPQPAPTAPAP